MAVETNGTGDLNAWQQLGLPKGFLPTGFNWSWGSLDITDATGSRKAHVWIVDGINGRLGFVFEPEALRRLAEQALEQVSGIQVVQSLPGPNRAMRRHPPNA